MYLYIVQTHVGKKKHSIDWKNALFIFNTKNKEGLQMLESTLVPKLPNFNLSSGFYSLPDNRL